METIDVSGLTPEQVGSLLDLAAVYRRDNVGRVGDSRIGNVSFSPRQCWLCDGRKGPLDPTFDRPDVHTLCYEKAL